MDKLSKNAKKSNGRLIDETGNKHGMLTVIRYSGSGKKFRKWHDGGAAWVCRCDCGKEIVALGTRLRMGIIKSCGEHWALAKGESSLNAKISVMKHSANRRGYTWNLTKSESRKLLTGNCVYCGREPSVLSRGRTCRDPFVCNGIDRVDNKGGYEIGNVVSCCPDCNRAKRIMGIGQFLRWFRRVIEHNEWYDRDKELKFKHMNPKNQAAT